VLSQLEEKILNKNLSAEDILNLAFTSLMKNDKMEVRERTAR